MYVTIKQDCHPSLPSAPAWTLRAALCPRVKSPLAHIRGSPWVSRVGGFAKSLHSPPRTLRSFTPKAPVSGPWGQEVSAPSHYLWVGTGQNTRQLAQVRQTHILGSSSQATVAPFCVTGQLSGPVQDSQCRVCEHLGGEERPGFGDQTCLCSSDTTPLASP